tara:strand:- start:1173 stop:3629 length:2457 start_codon:yes stop_codon:yes gene_type:complete
MELQKTKNDTSTLGLGDKKEFTIDTSNQMIVSILRDRLYSNKIGAVSREVASNCRDANREAGRESMPITIEIGTNHSLLEEEKLYVSFKDDGIGINPDRIDNVFLKYGSSTKRDNNNQTGGFGIGAKTPFAYNNEFIIETISEFKGSLKKHVYQAIILTDKGVESSQLILISEENSTEKTGTKIIVPIKVSDRDSFESEIITATSFWDVKPNYKGFTNSEVDSKELFVGEGWKVLSLNKNNLTSSIENIKHNSPFLIVDGIPYKMPSINLGSNSLINNSIVNYHYESESTHPVLEFKTGELTLSASREEVEETDENKSLILDRVLDMEKQILKEGEKLLKNKKTTLDKISFLNEINIKGENLKTNYLKDLKFSSNIESLSGLPKTYNKLFGVGSDNINLIEYPCSEQVRCSKKNLLHSKEHVLIKIEDLKNWNIIYKGAFERMNYRKSETLRQEDKPILFITEPTSVLAQEERKKVLKNCLKYLKESGLSVTQYSDVKETKVDRKTSSNSGVKKDKNIRTLYVREFSSSNYWFKGSYKVNISTKEIENIENLNEEGEEKKVVIVPIKGFSDLRDLDKVNKKYKRIFTDNFNEEKYSDLTISNSLLLLKDNYKIIAIKNSDIKNLDNKKYLNVSSAIDEILKDKELRTYLKAILKEKHFNETISITTDCSLYKKYSSTLGREYLKLANFNLDDYKVINKSKVKSYNISDNDIIKNNKYYLNCKNSYTTKSAFESLANNISSEFKMKKFDGFINEEILENQEALIKETNPAIHYVFQEVGGEYYSWSFSEYDKEGNSKQEGGKILKADLLKIIKLELKSK